MKLFETPKDGAFSIILLAAFAGMIGLEIDRRNARSELARTTHYYTERERRIRAGELVLVELTREGMDRAFNQAKPGATLELDAGSLTLTNSITVSTSMTVTGAGTNATILMDNP